MNKLKGYKLNKAFTDGVAIPLDNAEVSFMVRLPSQYNRGYQQAICSGMGMKLDEDGNAVLGGDIMVARYAQVDAFVEHCLLSMDGEAIPDDFAIEYPDAVSELLGKATEMANDIEDKVSESVKKSSGSATGKGSGQARQHSMSNSLQEAV